MTITCHTVLHTISWNLTLNKSFCACHVSDLFQDSFRNSLVQNRCICACSCAHMLIRVTPGPGPQLWSHSRGPERATHCTDLSSAHLCACGACWGFCSGVNDLNNSSPWRALGAVSQSEPGSFTSPPSYLTFPPMLNADWEFFLCPELLLSQLIYIRREWWSECSKSIFREQFFSPTTCLYTTSVTLLSLRPFFLFACTLTH